MSEKPVKYQYQKAKAISLAQELKDWASLNKVEQTLLIFEMRKTGFSHAVIAQAIGCSQAQVSQIIKEHTEERRKLLDQAVDDLREMECARLDDATRALWPDVLAGNARSIEVLLKVMERRAKLRGLDAPEKLVTMDLTDGLNQMSSHELVEAAKRLGLPTPQEDQVVLLPLPGEHKSVQGIIEGEFEPTEKAEQEESHDEEKKQA